MGAKYKQDNYLMIGFDDYGGKVFSRLTDEQNLTSSRAEGDALVKSGCITSFSILRVLYNSIDSAKADRWMPKEKPITLDPGPPSCAAGGRT